MKKVKHTIYFTTLRSAAALTVSFVMFALAACEEDENRNGNNTMGSLSVKISADGVANASHKTRCAGEEALCEFTADGLSSALVLSVSETEQAALLPADSSSATRAVPVYSDNFNALYGTELYGTAYQTVSGSSELTDPWGSGLGINGTVMYTYSAEDNNYTYDYENLAWPDNKSLRIFFEAPYSTTKDLNNKKYYADGKVSFDYSISGDSHDASADKDILFASTTRTPDDNNTPITMYHALAELRFKVSDDALDAGVVINSVKLNNVCSQGSCTISTSTSSDNVTWNPSENKTNISLSFNGNHDYVDSEGTGSNAIDFGDSFYSNNTSQNNLHHGDYSNGDVAMMLIPQTIGDDVTMDVTYTVDGGTPTTKNAIHVKTTNHSSWQAGTLYTYTLNVNPETWEIFIQAPDEVSFNGIVEQSQSFDVNCYKQSSSGNTEDVDWTLEYSSDSTNWSSTVPTGWTVSPNSSLRGQKKLSSTASARTDGAEDNTSVQGAILKNTQYIDFDLSYYDPSTNQTTTSQNTANCYVVNGYGTFKFPAVYGNRIKNGSDNIVNLFSASSNADEFNNKVNIENIASAELVWQDSPGLISSVGKTSLNGYDYVTFTVPNTTVKPGNALIAVKNSKGDILWSWHIWFVEQSLNLGATVDNKHYFMPINLGWVSNVSSSINFDKYDEKKVFLRIKAGDKEHTVTLKRNAYTVVKNASVTPTTNGYSCFYQWGRKEPLLCGGITVYGMGVSPLTTGFHDDNEDFSETTAKYAIKNPLSFLTNWKGNSTSDVLKYGNERWSAGIKSLSSDNAKITEVVKTIYDPSPVGYKIPNADNMSGMMSATTEEDKGSSYMYEFSKNNSVLAFWVGVGYYTGVNNGAGGNSKYQYCWTATCNQYSDQMNQGKGKYLYRKANTTYELEISYAMSIHPILDNQSRN